MSLFIISSVVFLSALLLISHLGSTIVFSFNQKAAWKKPQKVVLVDLLSFLFSAFIDDLFSWQVIVIEVKAIFI